MSRTIYKPYFSHDLNARGDSKMKDMFFELRKVNTKESWAAYGLYWAIIEYMHQEDFLADRLEMYADDFRVDIDFLKSVLDDYNFFILKDGKYISNRVIRNIEEQEKKAKSAKKSVEKRWNNPPKEEPAPQNEIDSDDVFITEILKVFKDCFNDAKIVSKENKEKIATISTENKLKIDDWNLIFQNAKRGWNYPDGKHVKPSLKKILEDWDSFHRGDNGLAPKEIDRAELEKEKQLQKEAGKKLDIDGLDTAFFVHDEYRCLKNTLKLEAQEVYRKNKPNGEDAAIKAMILYCREAVQNV